MWSGRLLSPAPSTTEEIFRSEDTPMCQHLSRCPSADSEDRSAAVITAHWPEQGWSVNCTFLRSLGTAMSDCPRSSV